MKNGELYLKHWYEGIELDLKYLEKVLPYIHQLWGRPVHMESIVESKDVVFSYDGKDGASEVCVMERTDIEFYVRSFYLENLSFIFNSK